MSKLEVSVEKFERVVEAGWAVEHATPWSEVPKAEQEHERAKLRAAFAAVGVGVQLVGSDDEELDL